MSETEKQRDRSGSPVFSSVSIKSDHSKGDGPNFSEETPTATKRDRPVSPVLSSVSIKSDHSKGDGPNFSEETPTAAKSNQRPETSVNIGSEINRWKALKEQRGIKSDEELATFLINRHQYETSEADIQNCKDDLPWIFKDLEYEINTFQKKELERFQKILRNGNIQDFVKDYKDENRIREAFLDITLNFLRCLKQDKHADKLEDELVYICKLKSNLEKRYQRVFEGIAKHGDSTLLNKIYTDIYITQGGGEQINTEHEVRQIEVTSRHLETSETQIEFRDLFKPHDRDQNIRSVLTKGVAGIGKSFSVQKFVLDWAEGKENQDINIIFPLPFREMNLKESKNLSLMDLISQFFPEITELNITRNYKKVLFIFDGLDECRLPLKFDSNEILRDITSPASLDVLLTNLIKGNLFPSALIWITTRPAATGKIPPECIDRVTEVRGFNDAQKEEYFRKRFTDENMANTIIHHVKKSKSLFIMCHIPVFCWISATVLQNILEKKRNVQSDNTTSEDTPKTLTQMYTHFFRFQIQQSRRKYEGEYSPDISWDKESILSLGKLAFQNLEKSNLIFYDTDLEACGIDITKASVYSGMCTQIFREETGITLGSVYCFVHLSIQEFIAALYAHLILDITKKNVFVQEHTGRENNETMLGLLKTAVDKALESENGHLDLFLRFLLGLSLESNQPLLRGLLTQEKRNEQSNKEIVEYIKQKFEDNSSAERSINLFYCLNELNDQSLVKEIQKHLREGSLSSADLSSAQWSALVFVLLTLEEEVEEFELQKFKKSDECLNRLSPVIKTCKQALLNDCNLTDNSCSALAKVLGSDSRMIELNMNNNNLKDDGIKLLCDGLENTKCELKLLRLSDCGIGEEGYVALCSAVRSNPSHLTELDLSGNDPGESGVQLIHHLIQDQNCALKSVRLLKSSSAVKAVEYLSETFGINPLLQRDLNLNDHKLQDSVLLQICDLLKDKHCRLNTLILSGCGLTEESCSALASVLRSKPGLKELDMSNNNLQDSGVRKLHNGLENTNCQLHKLRLSDCSIGEEGYVALSKAVRSNPSHLTELDLSGNDPGESGVKYIYDLIQDQDCALKKVRLLKSSSAAEVFKYLSETLGINILLQRELNLSDHKLNNTRLKQICDLLKDKHCRLNTLMLTDSCITVEGCADLMSGFNSNPSHIIHLDLSGNKLGDIGMKKISDLLTNPQCRLQKLRLSCCSIGEEGYVALSKAVRSNPSHLTELDLSGNDPGESGVKHIYDLIQDPKCALKTVRLSSCKLTEESCSALSTVLSSDSISLKELNLSHNNLQDSGVKLLSDGLMNVKCGLEILRLSCCSIGEEGYETLSRAVRSNPSHLIELDLSGNDPGESGVKLIYDLIQDQNCALKKVRLLKSSSAVKVFKYLSETLGINILLQRELNLSDHKLNDTRLKQICDLLKDKHCRLNTLMLTDSCITVEGCADLMSGFNSNPSHIMHLDLSGNKLGYIGMKKISDLLTNPQCRLQKLSLGQCGLKDEGVSALTLALCSNPSHLRQLDLSGNKLSDTEVQLLSFLLGNQQFKLETLGLCGCSITEKHCVKLIAALCLNPSHLRELNLSQNTLENLGVKRLCDLLKHSDCKLEKLKLSDCSIGEEGYVALSKAARSNPSHLIELDLSGNDPGESGVKHIYDLIQDQNCALKKVRLLQSPSAEEAHQYLNGVVGKEILLQRELNLNDHKLNNTRVKQICDLLKDKHCRLDTLILSGCGLTEESCSALASVLRSKPGLKELDMSNNKLQDSGVKKLQDGLQNTNCQLHKLRLSDCSIGEEGYESLSRAVRSNPSHLIELDLSGNDPGESGVKLIYDLIQDQNCALKKVRLLKSDAAEEACVYLNEVLDVHPLLLKELNLSDNKLGDLDGEKLSALLMDSHSKVKKIILNDCELTEKQCLAVAALLSCVKEIEMNNSRLMDSGVKQICDELKKRQCQIQRLRLSCCSIGEEGYVALSRAVRSNPSHLIELDLSGNDPGESGVKHIYDLIQDPKCALKTVRLLQTSSAAEGFKYLNETLGINPLLQRDLNLNDHKLNNTRVIQICDLLKDKHCRLNTLILSGCGLTEESCSALASVLRSKPGLKELDMSNNNLQDSGVKKLHNGLENTNCQLHKLRLSCCSIGEEGYVALCSAVRSNPSHLIELDLSGNDPGESGVKLIYDLIQDQNCALKKVRLLKSSFASEGFKDVSETLGINPLLQRDLNLNDHKLNKTRVKQICDLLKDKHCRLNTLMLSNSFITAEGFADLISVFKLNSSHIRHLDLSGNNLGDSGMKKISDLLTNPQCRLQKLRLSDCSIGEEGYVALYIAMRSNPSHLTELDLSGNDPGESGVKHIYHLLQDQNCALKKVRFLKSGAAEEACDHLSKVLDVHPLLVKELNLSDNKLGDLDGEKLSALLMDSHSKVKKIILNDCELTEKQCLAVAAVLSCVKEIEMNNSRLMDSGVKQICDELKKPQCQLQRLKLRACGFTDEGFFALTTALNSNPSHLRHLDLSENKLGDSGVDCLCDLLRNSQLKLKTLELCKCSIKYTRPAKLISALCSNPSHLKELNLSENKIKDSGVKHLCDLFKHSDCKLEKLYLNKCKIADIASLTITLSETKTLMLLNLSNNYINGSSLKQLYEVLKSSNCKLRPESKHWFSQNCKMPLCGDQSSSDEEDGETSSQNTEPKDQAEIGQSSN
ncbi:uncharacterized protein [Paramisgurnus dabryanus]|uniref:uncharacterized protein isoform X2 n=1 Tax=Paramisgurnus dabryanus TaxID=90735 RepID=UPI0031F46028